MGNSNLVTTIEVKDGQGRVVATKEVVTYAGLLNRAHEEGLKRVATKLIQAPSKENDMTAICVAEVVTEKGTYRDYGDANPGNVDSMIIPHLIRMAATRAKARALRDAVNIGVVAIEELLLEDSSPVDNGARQRSNGRTAAPRTGRRPHGRNGPAIGCGGTNHHGRNGNGTNVGLGPMTENQRTFIFRLLAQHSVSGDDAQRFLLSALGVASLPEITRGAASGLISELLVNGQALLKGAGKP